MQPIQVVPFDKMTLEEREHVRRVREIDIETRTIRAANEEMAAELKSKLWGKRDA